MMRSLFTWSAVFCLLATAPIQAVGQGVDELVVDLAPDRRPRIRIHSSPPTDLRHFELSGPDRLVFDLDASALTTLAPEVPPSLSGRITSIRIARFQTDVVRVVIDLQSHEPYSVEQQGGWWIVMLEQPNPLEALAGAQTSIQVQVPQPEAQPPEPDGRRPEPEVRRPDPEAQRPEVATTQPAATRTDTTPPTPQPDGTLEVRVTRVSGTTVYINAGADQGLGKGQTVQAERRVGRGRGTLEVLSTTSRGAVLGFAGRPFSITRGDGLRLKLPQTRGPDRAIADIDAPSQGPAPENQPRSAETAGAEAVDPVWRLPPNVTGRISMELDARGSRTDWDPFGLDATRTFLTPLTRLQFTAREVADGVTVRGRLRAAYRYGSDGVIDPTAAVRVYEFDAEKRFDAVPLRMKVGRFFSPYEASSGYWDGLLVRVGGDGFGLGGVVGLEPDRWNQGFSTSRPKASGFLDFRSSGRRGGIEADLAATHVRPTDSRPNQLYFGSSGRVWLGNFGVSHTVQVDRNSATNEWVVSDLLIQSRIPVSRAFELRGRWSRREPNYFWLDDPFSYGRDDIGGGTTIRWRGGAVLTDVTLHQVDGETGWTRSASTALRFNSVSPADLGMRAAVHVWDAQFGRVSTASLSVDRVVRDAWFSAAYRIYRSEGGWEQLMTHQVDATASWSLPDGVRVTGLASTLVGSGILQQRLQLGFSRSF
ncbi:MAG: hypothetical protein ACI9OJ_004023 [Myxococcota bacterium]|jgi:hypothetical protein